MTNPYGSPPSNKQTPWVPFYPFGEGALFATMYSYEHCGQLSDALNLKQDAKQMSFVAAPNLATLDIYSALVHLDSRNPQQGAWSAPQTNKRETQNAGNLPNPLGLGNDSTQNRFL